MKPERKEELREVGRDVAADVSTEATRTVLKYFFDWIGKLVQRGRERRARRDKR